MIELLDDIALQLKSPHVARSVLGAFLCQWLFSSPEAMCHDVYSVRERKLHEATMFASKFSNGIWLMIILTGCRRRRGGSPYGQSHDQAYVR